MKGWGDPAGGDALAADSVLGRAQVPALLLDSLGRIRSLNPPLVDLLQLGDARELRGEPLTGLGIHDSDHELFRRLLHDAQRGRPWEGTLAVVRGDSSWMYVRMQAIPLLGPSGGDAEPAVDSIAVFVRPQARGEHSGDLYGLLDRIGSRLSNCLEFDAAVKEVAGILVPQFADHCLIDLFEGDELVRRASVHAGDWAHAQQGWLGAGEAVHYPEPHFAQVAMQTQDTVVVDAGGSDPNPPGYGLHAGVSSAIAAPLRARGELLGVLTLALSADVPRSNAPPARTSAHYDAFDRNLVGAIASRVALAIDNARLFEEERSTALAFQNDLLPHSFPDFDGLTIAHRYIPARPLEVHGRGIQTQVGGDFYDVIPLSAGRVGIVVGDVEGRGPHAAAVMGQVRAAIRAFAQADREPADIMRELDEWVRQLGRPGPGGESWVPSVSCLYLVYDAWLRELFYANAGHAPPLLIVDGQVDELALEVSDALLGIRAKGVPYDGAAYHQAQLVLPASATLLLYTDGLVDRGRGAAGPDNSLAVLRSRVHEVADRDVEQIAKAAVAAVPGENGDDTALLVVRSDPSELGLRESWFVAEAEMVAEARHMAADTLAGWGMERDQAELACLLVSEVVTNVVLHASPPSPRRELGAAVSGADAGGEFSEDWSDLLDGVVPAAASEPKLEFLLRLRHGAASVWVEVFDRDLRLPRIRTATADDEGGRGLYLVDQLATRWGSRPTPDGKFVWFQIPMRSS